jgi:hypothetical protein
MPRKADSVILDLVRAMERWAKLDEGDGGVGGIPEELVQAYEAGRQFIGESNNDTVRVGQLVFHNWEREWLGDNSD